MIGGWIDEPGERQEPEHRVDDREERRSQDEEAEPGEPHRAELAPDALRIAHVDEPGLEVALVPARTLLDPVDEIAVRLLERDRVEELGPEAGAMEADAQVGVLGDVPGIPSADRFEDLAAEVVRRPAKRDRRLRVHETGKQLGEPERVLGGEPAGQKVLLGVVIAQPRLEAGDVRVRPARTPRRPGGAGASRVDPRHRRSSRTRRERRPARRGTPWASSSASSAARGRSRCTRAGCAPRPPGSSRGRPLRGAA